MKTQVKNKIELFSRSDSYEVSFEGKDYIVVYQWDEDGYYSLECYDAETNDKIENEPLVQYFTENNTN